MLVKNLTYSNDELSSSISLKKLREILLTCVIQTEHKRKLCVQSKCGLRNYICYVQISEIN